MTVWVAWPQDHNAMFAPHREPFRYANLPWVDEKPSPGTTMEVLEKKSL